jgi:hypothetical protein
MINTGVHSWGHERCRKIILKKSICAHSGYMHDINLPLNVFNYPNKEIHCNTGHYKRKSQASFIIFWTVILTFNRHFKKDILIG